MGVYVGVDGVSREVGHANTARDGVTRHSLELPSGVDGVVKQILCAETDVDHVEIDAYQITVSTMNSDGTKQSVDGYGLETAR